MKMNILRWTFLYLGLQMMCGCSPEEYNYLDHTTVEIDSIGKVELWPNQRVVLADGHAQLDLRPRIYTRGGYLIPDERIREEWLDFHTEQDIRISRYFSTADAAWIDKDITTWVEIKGTSVKSQPVTFKVIAPWNETDREEIVIPVVIHIIQTTEEIEALRGKYETDRIELLLQKMNNVFAGIVSENPVGVDTRIRFRFAQYDPFGKKMPEAGINRFVIREINTTHQFTDFLRDQHLVWPVDQFMNIWLISDRDKKVDHFGYKISDHCYPRYVDEGVEQPYIPEGLDLNHFPEGTSVIPYESGIIYRLQELDMFDRSFGPDMTNELIYYVGRYLGLSSTCSYKGKLVTDYCEDTMDYFSNDEHGNKSWYKTMEGYYFKSENIMDDPTGVHCSVSKDQAERMRWVLRNCPARKAWQNCFAFTGE